MPQPTTGARPQGEVHARKLVGEMVLNPDLLDTFLEGEAIHPPHPGFEARELEVEVRTALPEENPPNGAIWLTALDAKVSLKADPLEILHVLEESGILDRLREEGKLPFLRG